MRAPRLEVDLTALGHNATVLVRRLAGRGIDVTGVTKAVLACPEIAATLLAAGVSGLGDSRIENIERLRSSVGEATTTLIRSPMISQVERVVRSADVSCNTEIDVIAALSAAAVTNGLTHRVLLMVELGDLREGIMPSDLAAVVRATRRLPGVSVAGIGANLACQNGVVPDDTNMAELSALACSLEDAFDTSFDVVSGGNSAALEWALGSDDVGRVNDLRLGEAILLGCEPLHRTPIEDLRTDAFTLVAEVIESKVKPSAPWGGTAQTAFGQTAFGQVAPAVDRGDRRRAIVAIGHQDTDPSGLVAPAGMEVLGASSDHLVLDAGDVDLRVGDEVAFGVNYSALVRSMTSPFVASQLDTPSTCSPRSPA